MADDDVSVLRRRLAEAQTDSAQVAELREQLAAGETELARIAGLEDALQHERRRAEIAEAERVRFERELLEAGELRGRLERSEQLLRDLQASPSWRITRPLRAAKRLLG